jgi:hypothetical protein
MAATATDEKLAEGIRELNKNLAELRVDLADKLGKFQGSVETDLKWIKRIGASILLIAIGGSAWVIREITTVKDDVRHQGQQIDAMGKQLDILIHRTEPKPAVARGE